MLDWCVVTVIITMMSAALGLTCKDAFLVFSQQETLQLQRDNTELKARLAFYEPTPRFFETYEQYLQAERKAATFLHDWLHNNVQSCSRMCFREDGCEPFFRTHDLLQAFEHAVYMITSHRNFSYHISGVCLDIAEAAIQAAHDLDQGQNGRLTWYADERLVALTVYQALMPEKIQILIENAVEYPLDSDDEF